PSVISRIRSTRRNGARCGIIASMASRLSIASLFLLLLLSLLFPHRPPLGNRPLQPELPDDEDQEERDQEHDNVEEDRVNATMPLTAADRPGAGAARGAAPYPRTRCPGAGGVPRRGPHDRPHADRGSGVALPRRRASPPTDGPVCLRPPPAPLRARAS